MLDRLVEAIDDRREQRIHAEVRDHRIVHVEQQPQAIALAPELPLRRLRRLVVQHVIDGHGHLVGDHAEIFEL